MRMLLFHYDSLFVLLLCAFFVASTSANPVTSMEEEDKSVSVQDVNNMLSLLKIASDGLSSIPYLGLFFTPWIKTIIQIVDDIEINTNGALFRIFEKILPCILSVDGVQCTGIEKNGGFSAILSNVIGNIPETVIPSFLKMTLLILLQYI